MVSWLSSVRCLVSVQFGAWQAKQGCISLSMPSFKLCLSRHLSSTAGLHYSTRFLQLASPKLTGGSLSYSVTWHPQHLAAKLFSVFFSTPLYLQCSFISGETFKRNVNSPAGPSASSPPANITAPSGDEWMTGRYPSQGWVLWTRKLLNKKRVDLS